MPIAWNPEIHRAANVRPELDGVVAEELRPVVDELELPLVLTQRAVAARELQRVTEVELVSRVAARSVAVQEEGRHPPAEIIDVQSRNAGVRRRVDIAAARVDVDAVAEPAESEIGQKGRTKGVVD